MLRLACLLTFACLLGTNGIAQPEALVPGLTIRSVLDTEPGTIRLTVDPTTGDLYYLKASSDIYRITPPFSEATKVLAYTSADHGLSDLTYGLTVGPDGTLYVVGNERGETLNTGIIMRGAPNGDGARIWSVVAQTEPYPLSRTSTDHVMNGIAVSPDGESLFVNSGSRTDHGEIKSNDGTFPGLREAPITSAILRIPADAENLLLPNDEEALAQGGYLYADGVRNSFDLAFAPNGHLFAAENSGDRDDGDELNWIREGHHYGFPWRMGQNDTPQRFPGYDPDADLLVNPASTAYKNGWFYDDPTYPPPPAGVTFTDPVLNLGPAADKYRSPADGSIHDASDEAIPLATFTPHRSPLGLVFDTAGVLPGTYAESGFVLGWTSGEPSGSPLLVPFGDESEDLLHLQLTLEDEAYRSVTTRIARGFSSPIDVVLIDRTLYVVELGGENLLWALTFEPTSANEGDTVAPSLNLAVFPNPARAGSQVTLRLDGAASMLAVDVVDVLGRWVSRLHDGFLPTGEQVLHWDTKGIAAGLYLLRVQDGSGVRTHPITLVR